MAWRSEKNLWNSADLSKSAALLFACSDPKEAHQEYAERFLDPKKRTNYPDGHHKALLIIGSKKKIVSSRVEYAAKSLKGAKGGRPEIFGLVVSPTHDSFEMYCPGEGDPMLFICDRVAKSLQRDGHGRFVVVQMGSFINEPEEEAPPPAKKRSNA